MPTNLILPSRYVRRNAQMTKAVVFWFNRSADFIMCPPSPIAPPPAGFERIECRHAHEVDSWSARLRLQEKRVREMTEFERFEYEGKIQYAIIEEMKKCLANSTDTVNREFMAHFIKVAEEKRAKRQVEVMETYMHCEAQEGVAK
jgi:hypothetical protein